MIDAGTPGGRPPLIDVRRREFTLRVGTAAAWPGMSRSQKLEAVRRVVVLMGATETEWSRVGSPPKP